MKKNSIYTEKVLAHFKNPHNMGSIKKPDGMGKAGNIVCGDVMHLYIKVGKNKAGEEIIKDVKFETLGCVAAIATSSAITELVKGKTFKDALKLKKEDIVKKLGGLPPLKFIVRFWRSTLYTKQSMIISERKKGNSRGAKESARKNPKRQKIYRTKI